jgi:hypothetical protein
MKTLIAVAQRVHLMIEQAEICSAVTKFKKYLFLNLNIVA